MISNRQQLPDRHVRRSGNDYASAMLALLPTGQAWPRSIASTLTRTCVGLANYWGFVDSRAADLLERESDPRQTIELLPDWERAWGLPDPCFPDATSIGERQAMLVMKMTWMGGQSRAYFERVMDWLGFSITITEFAPFMCGVSEVGDTRYEYDQTGNYRWYIGPEEMRFYWTAETNTVGLVWFRCAAGECGVDHHLEFRAPEDLQCLLNRWQPAHTQVVFDFTNLENGDPMQGTP